jgi:mismatch-specific thymine-DNA glycosylase
MRSNAARAPQSDGQVLPDYLRRGLDVVFVGINPGLASAAAGHHYAGPTNHFWPLLNEAGFAPENVTFNDDWRTPEFGIGLTNIVHRASRNIDELTRDELRQGAEVLGEKLRRYRPRVIAFNGKSIAEAFLGGRVALGLQPERWDGMPVFVMPSTSARAATYQRPAKLAFFQELKRLVEKERSA